jgi:hypothetical protein
VEFEAESKAEGIRVKGDRQGEGEGDGSRDKERERERAGEGEEEREREREGAGEEEGNRSPWFSMLSTSFKFVGMTRPLMVQGIATTGVVSIGNGELGGEGEREREGGEEGKEPLAP